MPSLGQPYVAFVDLHIGGFDFTPLPPQYLLNFTHVRNMADTANQFSFSVYDDTALELELIIAEGARDVVFRYGYSDGSVSRVYQAQIWDYKLEFQHGGVVLNVEGTSTVLGSHAVPATRTFEGKTIDQIVKEIADIEGWKIGYIEPCVGLKGFYDTGSANEILRPFYQQNISSTKFIKEELLPYAVSSRNGEAGFVFYFDDKAGGPYLYFCPPSYRQKPKYNWQLDYNMTGKGSIISFSPEVQGSVLMAGGGTATTSGMDGTTNDMVTIEFTDSSNGDKVLTGSKSAISFEAGKTAINMSGMTAAEMESKLNAFWSKSANLTYPATLELIGSPDVDPNTTVEVLIVTNKGKPHHTSGIYLVQEVTDEVGSSGNYTTTCKLIKNAVAKGTVNKVGKDVNDEPAPTPAEKPPAAQGGGTESAARYYVVVKGDSLWKIAKQYYGNGALYTKIAAANPQIKNPNLIYPGQKFLIP
jgi:LysM repeat protein